jgi:hypothetical protein
MVAYIISDWESEIARNLFVGGAVVLIQIPACYVRSYPLYSYSGTVTGFTVAMLLLTSNATTAFAVNRIIDTYVGVTIYMVLEFLAAATFTEDEIISDMRQASTLAGLPHLYPFFHTNRYLVHPIVGFRQFRSSPLTIPFHFFPRCSRELRRNTRISTGTSISSRLLRTPARRCARASAAAR